MTNETVPHENGVADPTTQAILANATAASAEVTLAPDEPAAPAVASFDDLGLHPEIKQAIDDMGYFTPTPVQTAVFGPVTERKDLMVQSRTGTGKTAAFGLPLLNRIVPAVRQPQAMILAPTRELALQVARELTQIAKHRGIIIEPIYGGAPIGKQISNLKAGVHVIVGTPGRVLDLIGRRALDTKTIDTFVLDECDEMLSMGFLPDIEEVVKQLPDKAKLQTLLFSATMPDEVLRYARRHMKAPENLSLSRDGATIKDIHHAYYIVSGIARGRDLLKVIYSEEPESAIIFCNMRDETTMVAKYLQKQGLDAEPLSSDLSQADRERVMGRMKAKSLRFLVATDVAARGIDISNLTHVINFMVPMSPEIYVHRTGRTGRAGKKGVAISLVGPRELGNFRYVRLQFDLKPEERLMPHDDIFVGKLKVPLPPVGNPTPPDPVQILARGVSATPTELERQLLEKLLAKQDGKRVLAVLLGEKLNQLTSKSRPRRERPERTERDERPESREMTAAPEGEAPAVEGGERPRFDRERGDRDRGGDRGDRPRFGGGDRDRGGDRGDRGPRFGGGGDRDRGPRGGGGDRDRGGDRGPRFGGDRDRGRDRHERRDERPPVIAADGASTAPVETMIETTVIPTLTATEAPRTDAPREARNDGDRERDRREYRGGRDRNDRGDRGGDRHEQRNDRGERGEHRGERHHREDRPVVAAPPAPAPVIEAPAPVEVASVAAVEPPTKVEDVAARHVERADRDRGKKGDKKKAEPGETKEFWETWAAEKTTREPAPVKVAAVAAEPEAEVAADEAPAEKRGGRDRGRGKRDDKKPEAKADKKHADKKADAKPEAKADKKSDKPAAVSAPATGADAKLFISLGKKQGVTADDLRALLAGPVGGDKTRIGSVMLRDGHAHVKVAESDVAPIIAALHGTKHDKHDVTVERARA